MDKKEYLPYPMITANSIDCVVTSKFKYIPRLCSAIMRNGRLCTCKAGHSGPHRD